MVLRKKKEVSEKNNRGNNFPLIGQFILYDVICMFVAVEMKINGYL
jgi:hypothetical protein